MNNKSSLGRKVILFVASILAATVAALTIIVIIQENQRQEQQDKEKLSVFYEIFLRSMDMQSEKAVISALSVAENPEVQKAFAVQDRDKLIELTLPIFSELDESFSVPQAQFHLAPATSFLRLHEPEKFGDDLSSFRATVLAANETHAQVAGLEKGKGGYGIRGIVPMTYDGKPTGTFEIGLDFDKAFLENFKLSYGTEASVFLYEASSRVESFNEESQQTSQSNFTLYASTQEMAPELDETDRLAVIETLDPHFENLAYNGKQIGIISAPLLDYTGTAVGLIEIFVYRDDAIAQLWQERGLLVLISLGLLAVFSLVGWRMSKAITNPIVSLTRVASDISSGITNVEITYKGSDEIGQLADSFRSMATYLQEMSSVMHEIGEGNLTVAVTTRSEQDSFGNSCNKMVNQLQSTMGQLDENAKQLKASAVQLAGITEQAGRAATQISSTIQQVSAGSTEQNHGITKITASVEQMNNAIEEVARGAQEQAKAINKASLVTSQINTSIKQVADSTQAVTRDSERAASQSREGTRTVQETIAGMEAIRSTVEISEKKVEEMGERSSEIGTILETIEDIASQTNLLALNAAIEAARAGEQGKGFAVVADEVRKLAERSSLATREIAELIKGIQATVRDAVDAMKTSAAEVKEGVLRANSAGTVLESILAASESVHNEAEEAGNNAEKVSKAAEELVEAVDSVSAIIEENTAATEQMAANSSELIQSIEFIASVSEENNAAVEEVTASTEEVSQQVNEASGSASSLKEMAQSLAEMVDRFRV